MTARDYLRILREGWLIIVICTTLGTAGATVVVVTSEPVYEATSTLAVSACVAVQNSPICDPVGGMSFAIQRARIYTASAKSLPVLRRALELTDVVSQRSDLETSTTVTQLADSPVINVAATSNTPAKAASIANALAQALVEYARKSIDSFESESSTVSFSVVSEATPPLKPADSLARTILLGLVLGLLVGLGFALVRYFADGRVRDLEEAESLTGIDVLASLPLGKRSLHPRPEDLEATADAFRRLRAPIRVRAVEANVRTLLVVSPSDGETSSAVANGLARAMAESGDHIVLVDLDFSSVDDSDATDSSALGVIDVIDGSITLNAAIQQIGDSTLSVLPAGSATSALAPKLVSPRLNEILTELTDRFDFVILNAAPVLPSADALSVARFANKALIVAMIGATKREDLRESLHALELAGTTPLGLVAVTQATPKPGRVH